MRVALLNIWFDTQPIAIEPDGGQVTRFSAQTHRIEAGESLVGTIRASCNFSEMAVWIQDFATALVRSWMEIHKVEEIATIETNTQIAAWVGGASRSTQGGRHQSVSQCP